MRTKILALALGLMAAMFALPAYSGALFVAEVSLSKDSETITKRFSAMDSDIGPFGKVFVVPTGEKGITCSLKIFDTFGVVGATIACGDTHPVTHEFSTLGICAPSGAASAKGIMTISTLRKGKLDHSMIVGVLCYQP